MLHDSAHERGRFAALLRAEARKLRTVRSTPVLALALVVLTFLEVALPIASGDLDPVRGAAETTITGPRQTQVDRLREVFGASGIAGILAMILAAVAVSSDARHGTLVTTLLAEPRRRRVGAAHITLHLVLGLALGCLAVTVIVATAPVLLAQRHMSIGLADGEVALILAGVAVHTALYAGLGAAIGLLVPSQSTAVATALLGFGVVEPLVSAAAGPIRALTTSGASDALLGFGGSESPIVGAAVLIAWLLVASVGAVGTLVRRDLG